MGRIDDVENLVETVDADGNVISFNLFDIFEFDNKEYALLIPLGSTEEGVDFEDDEELVIMRLINENDEYSFETIDDDEEFQKVSDHLAELAEEEE